VVETIICMLERIVHVFKRTVCPQGLNRRSRGSRMEDQGCVREDRGRFERIVIGRRGL